jgi:transketolase
MTADNSNYRRDIINSIIPYARKDERIVLLVCDMGFGVTNKFQAEFPKRIYNMGIMEQGTVGVAAGMAMTGLIPVVYSIVNFIVYRALEQVRNDVKLQNLNVKFIATGVNDYFKFLGPSHTSGQDDIKIMEMIDLPVYDPYQLGPNDSYDGMVDRWITSKSAGYFRV